MKDSVLARKLSTLFVIFFSIILFISVAYAVDSNVKMGKYRVGINYSPLMACAVWVNSSGSYNFRAVNNTEYLKLSGDVFGLSVDKALLELEKITSIRALTPDENAFCIEVKKLDVTVLKAVPSSTGTRRTRDITATTYTKTRVPDSSLCEGVIIKKYQKNKNWHKVVGLNLTTLCGKY